MTNLPATVAPKWAIARNHAPTVEEDAIREAPVVPTRDQAGRWQAITDTTTIESSLVDLKEKGATPQDRRFLYVDCIKRTTPALGVGVEKIEPDHHLLNDLVMSFVAQVERVASVGSRAGVAVGNPDVVRLSTSSEDKVTTWYYSTQLIEVVYTYDLGDVSHIQRIGCQTEKNMYLTLTDPLRIQPWSQDGRNQTKSNRK